MSRRTRLIIGWILVVAFLAVPIYALAQTYFVAPGDSLWRISQKFGVSILDIKRASGLTGDVIYPGQKLEIPTPPVNPGTPTNPGGGTVTPSSPEYAALKKQIQDFLAARPGVTAGVYFKDVQTGKTFGINDAVPIKAASTIKLPVVLYLNELAAEGKVKWSERVAYVKANDWQDGAGILQFSAQDGDTYSLRVLSNLSITISDNIAYKMISRHLGRNNIVAYMKSLGGQTVFPNGENITTARDMGIYVQAVLDFARTNPELGNRLLDDMSNPIYHVGLPGKLPANIKVAHKEGDVWGVANDVGVVFGSKPYVLTVLQKDITDLDQAFADIAQISKMVYDYQEQLAAQESKPGGK